MKKYVYGFEEGDGSQKDLLGGKGANLAEMTSLGIPVPPGFTITTEACNQYLLNEKKLPEHLWEAVLQEIKILETKTEKGFGDAQNPLLVSVRSGAKISMPGMMDTILNLGLNDQTVEGLAQNTGNKRFAYDSYRRFIQMFSDVVLGVDHKHFETIIQKLKKEKKKKEDTEIIAEEWQEIIVQYKKIVEKETGSSFPENPEKQLERAIRAVFESWLIPRAITYRRIHKIPESLGTAVNVQSMVFGNMGDTSGTGVAFTRNPSDGEKILYGEFLMNAQGEDVVAGIRTPKDISALHKIMPQAYGELQDIAHKLENHFRDMQDLEFTIENKKLYMLQTRSGKRAAAAGLKIAIDMVDEGLITRKEAVLRVDPNSINQMLHPKFASDCEKNVIAKGLPASPGAAVGKIVFTADKALEWKNLGEKVILVRHETSPEDIHGMHSAEGILTSCGGMTSHAAVVARGMGKPCVAGAGDIVVDEEKGKLIVGKKTIREGEFLSLDGALGEVILGPCKTEAPDLTGNFRTILDWAGEFGTFRVRTNADTPKDAQTARDFGAMGIGLCRTEHMFFEEERIAAVREMILAHNSQQREKALSKLLPYQKADFREIFRVMDGLPVTVRLLDPPLHEFLPEKEADIIELAKTMNVDAETLKERVLALQERNPMLGHRGCRLMISYPEIARMQARAIIEAACEMTKEGIKVFPEIMIPLVGLVSELKFLKKEIQTLMQEIFEDQRIFLKVKIGTMIEVPRACIVADEIAECADFFSFGTNDLTQMVFGYSRDDAGKFLPQYVEEGYLKHDPFQVLDQEGVGRLIMKAVARGRNVNPDLKVGICGEHGGDPSSIEFCFHQDFNYVSCSPYRVPVARLAVAQSFLRKWA